MSIRDELLAENKILTPVEFTSSAGKRVYIRVFTGVQRGEWDAFTAMAFNEEGRLKNPGHMRAKLTQLSLCEPDGTLVFQASDLGLVLGLKAAFLEEIFIESARVNLLTEAEVAKARENFRATRANDSSTASPGNAVNPTPNSSAAN